MDAPVQVGNLTLYYRGRYILDAIFKDLLPKTAGATDVVLKGCSAGGQAAFIHANFLASLFSHVPRFSVVPGAGFFMDVVSYITPMSHLVSARPISRLFPSSTTTSG